MSYKQLYQHWFSNNLSISHVIHITPMYGVKKMTEIFNRVNWELCKTFLPNRFPNFKEDVDRFNFYVFPQTFPDTHYHLLVHSPQFVTKKMVGNCVCFNSLKTCEICTRKRLEELFLEVDKKFKLDITEKYWDRNDTEQTRVLYKGNIRINDIYDNTYDATQQIYVTRDFSYRMDLKPEDDFFVIPERF